MYVIGDEKENGFEVVLTPDVLPFPHVPIFHDAGSHLVEEAPHEAGCSIGKATKAVRHQAVPSKFKVRLQVGRVMVAARSEGSEKVWRYGGSKIWRR